LSIKNFINLNINDLISFVSVGVNDLLHIIKQNTTIPKIKDIIIDTNKYKGGFIADVIGFNIITNDNNVYSQIIKYENKEPNQLSNMAKSLELYEREYYFYTNISPHVKVHIPKFYNLVFDNDGNTKGIVLENLFEKKYKINLNLNDESIDITLLIVNRMANLHCQFWNKKLNNSFPRLKYSTDACFRPFFNNFISERYELFKLKWFNMFTTNQQNICNKIYNDFSEIQTRFSIGNNLTFIHGDIKSPNIFYDINNNFEPYFIDWQHCAIGKGVQDLIFFILESFDIINIKSVLL
jgi:hypothetical protein